jgi:D-sedoheptulose 7-phosphate isomerase
MSYPERYRTELLNALKNLDLQAVEEVVDLFRDAHAFGRCIFVCGSGTGAIMASHVLCDSVRSSTVNRPTRFRIFALTDEAPQLHTASDNFCQDCVIVDQLRAVANPGDLVVGISSSGSTPAVVRAVEFANEIGCRTISICGAAGGILEPLSDVAILVPSLQRGSAEDAQMIVCRMIGHFFCDFDWH